MRGRFVALLGATAMLLSGCGVLSGGLRGVDLPGGADLGDDPYSVTIRFADVADLVPQSLVKVADVPVGSVSDIRVDPQTWDALVTVKVNRGVTLPGNSRATVRATSLLGEKFVELAPPAQGATGTLRDGATIPIAATGRAAEVEEVLGALSMLLNGGGVGQIKTISTELNKALSGNEPEIRSLLTNLDTLVGTLDTHKSEITRALDSINRLAATLAERRGQITDALQQLGPGIQELADQREQLVDMLKALDRLSGVATDVVDRSRDDLVADLRALQPTLAKLAESGQDLPNSLEMLGTFPFTDAAVPAFAGDYANLYVRADLDLKDLLDNLSRSREPLIGPDAPLLNQLPGTAALLAPLLGGDPDRPAFPLLGDVLTPLTPDTPQTSPPPPPPADATTPGPPPGTTTAPPGGGGLLGGILGGGR
ncbi:ABC transporter substrate-binding protein [Pseudonocardia sulfidoxydans NBRC 16205]|uniref:ABC transporter substrate-binding protein n=2 Tax=Pseudonocardia sulfidoxydans TaxID=54011 RepID=A0A511DB50_9PSEU|nr:MCE family protein [Pseudonocardia sulfidoxydans]GEL22025.1 ABC transporter substrate-binding protein [Pseudonocardia sulfidoxydans NBRC 16205]